MTDSPAPRPRKRTDPARRRMGLAILMVIVGSFLPWLYTGVGMVMGGRGPGLWTFYASMFGLGAAFLPWRRVAAGHALVMGVACLALPLWQLLRAVDLLGLEGGWSPGPGILLVGGGGVLALLAARELWQHAQPVPA